MLSGFKDKTTPPPALLLSIYGLMLPLFISLAGLLTGIYSWFQQIDFMGCMLFLISFAALLTLFHVSSIRSANRVAKLLLVLTGISMWQWWLLGNGVVWYGLQALVFASLVAFWFLQNVSKDIFLTKVAYVVIGCFVFVSILFRLNSYLPTYNPMAKLNDVFIRYASGDITDEGTAFAENNKQFSLALAEINAHPDAKVLRIGTFANYFIITNGQYADWFFSK